MQKNLKVSIVASIFGVCLIGGVMLFQPKNSTVTENQSTETIEQTVETIEETTEEPSTEYELTAYDRSHIRFYLQELENRNITEDDLSEIYEKYGDKVDEVKEEMEEELEEEARTEKPVESTLLQVDCSADGFISYSCNENLTDTLLSYVNKVPNGVLNAIKNVGYHMELVKDPGAEFGYSNICGITHTNTKRILIEAKESKFRRSVVHEIGHALDDYLGFVSTSNEFQEIYETEKNDFKVTGFTSYGHHKSNAMEYFAEAFQMYVYDAGTLQSSAPKTYEFIKSCIDRVS